MLDDIVEHVVGPEYEEACVPQELTALHEHLGEVFVGFLRERLHAIDALFFLERTPGQAPVPAVHVKNPLNRELARTLNLRN